MTRPTPVSLADKLAGLVDKLFCQLAQPAPVLVPATVRRPQPVRIPVERR
jgi:hypothetical protein